MCQLALAILSVVILGLNVYYTFGPGRLPIRPPCDVEKERLPGEVFIDETRWNSGGLSILSSAGTSMLKLLVLEAIVKSSTTIY